MPQATASILDSTRRWQAVFGRSVPEHLTADLLWRMIANRIQEEAFGTFDRATLKLLDGLAGRTSRPARNLKMGTVLVRDYHGRRHTVTGAQPLLHLRRDTGYHTCPLGADAAAAAGVPPGPSALCRGCALAGRGGEGQQKDLGP